MMHSMQTTSRAELSAKWKMKFPEGMHLGSNDEQQAAVEVKRREASDAAEREQVAVAVKKKGYYSYQKQSRTQELDVTQQAEESAEANESHKANEQERELHVVQGEFHGNESVASDNVHLSDSVLTMSFSRTGSGPSAEDDAPEKRNRKRKGSVAKKLLNTGAAQHEEESAKPAGQESERKEKPLSGRGTAFVGEALSQFHIQNCSKTFTCVIHIHNTFLTQCNVSEEHFCHAVQARSWNPTVHSSSSSSAVAFVEASISSFQ